MFAKRSIQLVLLLLMFTLVSACSSVDNNVWEKINSGALLVDVRTPAEYERGHLDGALLIPHVDVAKRIAEFGTDKSRSIVLYCKSGGRAGKAFKVLTANGFTNVVNGGGYKDLLASKP